MDRPPPRGAPWELVWSANSQRPYLQKGRSHAHVKWRLCGRPRYGLMVCRATYSLDLGGPYSVTGNGLRAIAAPLEIRGVHVVHQFPTLKSRQLYSTSTLLFTYRWLKGQNQRQAMSMRGQGRGGLIDCRRNQSGTGDVVETFRRNILGVWNCH